MMALSKGNTWKVKRRKENVRTDSGLRLPLCPNQRSVMLSWPCREDDASAVDKPPTPEPDVKDVKDAR